MKNRLLFGLGGAVVGGAFALFIYTGGTISAMRWPAAPSLILRAIKERQMK